MVALASLDRHSRKSLFQYRRRASPRRSRIGASHFEERIMAGGFARDGAVQDQQDVFSGYNRRGSKDSQLR